MKKSLIIFVFGVILLSVAVSAASEYYADEKFGDEEDCEGYIKVFSLNGTDGNGYFYCVRMAPYSLSEEFLIDSYLVFDVEECLSGYDLREIVFDVYKTAADRVANKTETVSLCRKRQSRSTEVEIMDIDYTPFSDSACSVVRDIFIDGSGDVFYHCQQWDPGVISADSGECEDTDGGDVKTVDEIELQYGIVLDEDAYGFDPPISGLTFPEGEMPVELKKGKNFVEVKKDYCVGKYKLKEYYCDVATRTAVGVEMDCPNGGECDNGKCLGSGVPRGDQDDIEECYDIDSGKDNLTIPAYIDFFDGVGAGYRYYDVCADDGNGLFEYFCKDGESGTDSKSKFLGEESVACACSGEICTGEVVPGEACADGGNCLTGDSCLLSDDCRPGLLCLDGKCAREYDAEYPCSDTDSDYGVEKDSIFVAGSAKKKDIWIFDRCVDSHLWEAACYGNENTEPQELILKYVFKRCPDDGDCRDDGEGGYCVKPADVPNCERLVWNVRSGESGNSICKDRYDDDDAWCDKSSPPEVLGAEAAGCEGPRDVTCETPAPQDLRASIKCCWNEEYDEDDGKIGEGDEEIVEGSGGDWFSGIGDLFGGLVGLLPYIFPLLLSFI